jgi:predicted kinase
VRAPVLVVTMGLPASGKTTLARALAGRLGMVHLSSDVVRKRLARVSPTVHCADPFGRGLYSQSMSRRTYTAMRRYAARWLRRGQSVVLDATYGQRRERAEVRHLARRAGVRLVVLECRAPDEVLLARLSRRENDAARTSDARVELWPALRASYTPPVEMLNTIQVDTTQSPDDIIQEALTVIRETAQGSARAA